MSETEGLIRPPRTHGHEKDSDCLPCLRFGLSFIVSLLLAVELASELSRDAALTSTPLFYNGATVYSIDSGCDYVRSPAPSCHYCFLPSLVSPTAQRSSSAMDCGPVQEMNALHFRFRVRFGRQSESGRAARFPVRIPLSMPWLDSGKTTASSRAYAPSLVPRCSFSYVVSVVGDARASVWHSSGSWESWR